MSEMSGLQHAPAMMPAGLMALLGDAQPLRPPTELQAHEVDFRCLRGHEIRQVLHLRKQIRLPASAVAERGFADREKKETNPASSALSCGTVKP
ncbi:MAG: hypothetical protein EOO21_00045 [Comamonadaceae bacterium]|nr:MAG: hypothetical protein EOO21_00045 [Comamonadaceae bacterium]